MVLDCSIRTFSKPKCLWVRGLEKIEKAEKDRCGLFNLMETRWYNNSIGDDDRKLFFKIEHGEVVIEEIVMVRGWMSPKGDKGAENLTLLKT